MKPELGRKIFEQTVGATLALDLSRNMEGSYQSPKTQNCWISFRYGWMRGEGCTKSLPVLLEEIVHGNDSQH